MPARIKPIKGVPGYFVGSDGRVWSAWRTRGRKKQRGVESYIGSTLKEMALRKHNGGYLSVALRREGQYLYFLVHRLILETFVCPCPEGSEGCHKDGDKKNNRVGNLYWGTRQQNRDDAVRMDEVAFGERNSQTKLTENEVVAILKMLRGRDVNGHPTYAMIGNKFGISPTAVGFIARGINWRRVKEKFDAC